MERDIRDVRTLLLCKVHRQHQGAYQKICHIRKAEQERRPFFTVGDFDALVVYRMRFERPSQWLEELLKDKRRVFQEMRNAPDVSYHPLHIVANMEGECAEERYAKIQEFWSDKTRENFPFLVVTFVYGAAHPDLNQSYEDALWDYLAGCEDEDKSFRYAVYNSVNLCDLVVLWYTRNITETLKKALSFSFKDMARETYTFVNLPLKNGTLDVHIRDSMRAMKESFPIGIRGSIRDGSQFHQHVYRPLFLGVGDSPPLLPQEHRNCRISFGEHDFSITAKTDGLQFWNLMKYFLEASPDVDKSCWNIFTEFQVEYSQDDFHGLLNSKQEETEPNHILDDVYRQFLEIYPELSEQNYLWADVFLELSSIHSRIDKLPVLHGPSYLVWGCLRVANLYLRRQIPGYSKDAELTKMLQESRYSIERFVREWNQLTAQITKMDDVVFHHLGSTAAIYTTLSEPMLEMYHLFLSRFSAWLSSSDLERENIVPVYSFLLVPTLSQQMRISKMFAVEPDTDRDKQAYIIEFPMEFVYHPSQFVVQLAHECMHIFGDGIRQRNLRLQNMISYLCFEIMERFSNVYQSQNLLKTLNKKFAMEIRPFCDGHKKLYLEQVVKVLKRTAKNKILTPETFGLLCDAAKTPEERLIFQNDAINAWVQLSEDFSWLGKNFERESAETPERCSFEEIIDACAYYFKECYADAMVIQLLGITPFEYLMSFRSEAALIASCDSAEGVQFIQRVAIVLTACLQESAFCQLPDSPSNDLSQEIAAALEKVYDTPEMAPELWRSISRCLACLREDVPPKSEIWPPDKIIRYSTLNGLRSVVYYLRKTLQNLKDERYDLFRDSAFSDSKNLFSSIIRGGKFFGHEFYKKIFEYHRHIRNASEMVVQFPSEKNRST